MASKTYIKGIWRSDAKNFAKCGNTRYYHRYVCSSDINDIRYCKYKKERKNSNEVK